MVTVEVAGTVLAFAVFSLVKVFHDQGASRLCSLVVSAGIGDEHGEGLCAVAKFRRDLLASHDAGSLAARLPSNSPTLVQWTLIAA